MELKKSNIHKTFIKEKSISKVILYGSVSQGKGQPNSDIDLFILKQAKADAGWILCLLFQIIYSLLTVVLLRYKQNTG
jgi:predicted nucleotidyltransferase